MDLREGFGLKSNYFHPHVTIGYSEDIHSWWEARMWEGPFRDTTA